MNDPFVVRVREHVEERVPDRDHAAVRGAPPGVDWERLVAHAGENTTLYPGDLLAR